MWADGSPGGWRVPYSLLVFVWRQQAVLPLPASQYAAPAVRVLVVWLPPSATLSCGVCWAAVVWSAVPALAACRGSGRRLEWEAPGRAEVGRGVAGGLARVGASVAGAVGAAVGAGFARIAWPRGGLVGWAVALVGMTAGAEGLEAEPVERTAGRGAGNGAGGDVGLDERVEKAAVCGRKAVVVMGSVVECGRETVGGGGTAAVSGGEEMVAELGWVLALKEGAGAVPGGAGGLEKLVGGFGLAGAVSTWAVGGSVWLWVAWGVEVVGFVWVVVLEFEQEEAGSGVEEGVGSAAVWVGLGWVPVWGGTVAASGDPAPACGQAGTDGQPVRAVVGAAADAVGASVSPVGAATVLATGISGAVGQGKSRSRDCRTEGSLVVDEPGCPKDSSLTWSPSEPLQRHTTSSVRSPVVLGRLYWQALEDSQCQVSLHRVQ